MSVYVHGDNLEQKEHHPTKYRDATSRQYLAEIRPRYDAWKEANLALHGPTRNTVRVRPAENAKENYDTKLKKIIEQAMIVSLRDEERKCS